MMTQPIIRFNDSLAWNIQDVPAMRIYPIIIIVGKPLNNGRPSLAVRKEKNHELSKQYNERAVQEYANEYRNHTLDRFLADATLTKDIFNWEFFSTDARKEMFPRFVNACATFRQNYSYNMPKTKIKTEHPNYKNAMASARNGVVTAYQNTINCDDINKVLETVAHECDHLSQEQGKSTLSKDTVKIATENYIEPHEDEKLYRENILEQEAYTTGRIVGYKFKETLARMIKTR